MANKFKKGDLLKCSLSASPGYKTGALYRVTENEKGILGIKADDGFFDPLNMLVSSFFKVEETATEKALRNWKNVDRKT